VIVAVATSRQRADALAAHAAAAAGHQSIGHTVYDAVYVRPLAADSFSQCEETMLDACNEDRPLENTSPARSAGR
jgi:hypothetical protein